MLCSALRRRLAFSSIHVFAIVFLLYAQQLRAEDGTEKWELIDERWYILEIGGAKAGFSHAVTEKTADQYRTTSDTQMEIDRGGVKMKIRLETAFIETLQGEPINIEFLSEMSRQPKRSRWKFTPEHIIQTTIDGERKSAKKLPLPQGEWLTPQAADRFAKQQRDAGVQEFTFRTLDPQNGAEPLSITSKRVGEGVYDHGKTSIPVTIWSTTTDVLNVTATEKFDAAGNLVHQDMPLMGMSIVMRLSSKEEAQAAGGQVPELLFASVIKPDKPIANHMKAARATLRLKTKNGQMPELPSCGAQRFVMGKDGRTATLTIDINDNLEASEAEASDQAYLDSSTLVDSDDPLVRKLAQRADAREVKKEGVSDAMKRAEALRRLVRRHITRKGMETAFAAASETARMKEGDCSEHGVLLCALLRADGIPARVATGLVYADAFAGAEGIFGWHMWTQALIDGKWVDFDATLPVRYNATHVLTSTSSLADGLGAGDMAAALQLIGNLEIEVVDVQYE